MKRIAIFAVALLIVVLSSATAATWTGFWGGGNPDLESQFPGITEIEPGRWTDLPLCWGFGEGVRDWSDLEQEIVRVAIDRWNNVEVSPNGEENALRSQIFENASLECLNRPTDILLIWGDETTLFQDFGDLNGDGNSTQFAGQESIHVAERMAPILPGEPCQDLLEAGVIDRCSILGFNVASIENFFFDETPLENEEFELQAAELCSGSAELLVATEGGPADELRDFLTLIERRFGFAIGLQDDVGCDGSIFTFESEDDRGSVMWPSTFSERRTL